VTLHVQRTLISIRAFRAGGWEAWLRAPALWKPPTHTIPSPNAKACQIPQITIHGGVDASHGTPGSWDSRCRRKRE
jgi:hypothetical protein